MALPRTREQLKSWCLRRLGHPVIEINVDNHQLEERIDEAIDFYQLYHFDGVERFFFKHKLQASKFEVQSITGSFIKSEKFEGSISGIKGRYFREEGNELFFLLDNRQEKDWVPGETITGTLSGATAVLETDPQTFFTLGDIDRGSILLPERILSITNIFPLHGFSSGSGMFNVKYQFALNDMHSLASTDLISYDMFKRHLALLDELFVGDKSIRFNRNMGEVFLDIDWYTDVKPDEFVVFDTLAVLDPLDYPRIYSDYFLRHYTYALFKLQWGNNLKKYKGIQLPGGVTLDGDSIYQEAKQELQELEEKARKEFQIPTPFIVG
jgi:hypothetical protein